MKPQQLEKWRVIRGKGKQRFVLMNILAYGLPMFILMTFVFRRGEINAAFIAVSAIIWAIGGAIFGAVMWYFQERQYLKAGGDKA